MILHIGLDDTDSKNGMCTTYIGAIIFYELLKIGAIPIDFPRLIRLNPNWVWKTRGNAAIALSFKIEDWIFDKVKRKTIEIVEKMAEKENEDTHPGIVFYKGEKIPDELKNFSKKVIKYIVTLEEAEEIAKKIGAEIYKIKLGRGIIGALAAIGEELKEDYTYELIAYRKPENWGTKRRIDKESVIEMDKKTYPYTFDNIDYSTNDIRITPHTPCPVLYGIRSNIIEAAFEAKNILKINEEIERILLFKTNQATDAHINKVEINDVKPFLSVSLKGKIISNPFIIQGGHVFFWVGNGNNKIRCAAYEPTKKFRNVILSLREGDVVEVYGGIKPRENEPLTINLEKIKVIEISKEEKINPLCPKCNKRMKSAGKNKGFICKKCGFKSIDMKPLIVPIKRYIKTGFYEVPPRARRHLSKPICRMLFRKEIDLNEIGELIKI
ncbi:MAG: tRNA(Ile)(2)-agmatinylcytidine synthase [Nitrososphaerota archaeon]